MIFLSNLFLTEIREFLNVEYEKWDYNALMKSTREELSMMYQYSLYYPFAKDIILHSLLSIPVDCNEKLRFYPEKSFGELEQIGAIVLEVGPINYSN